MNIRGISWFSGETRQHHYKRFDRNATAVQVDDKAAGLSHQTMRHLHKQLKHFAVECARHGDWPQYTQVWNDYCSRGPPHARRADPDSLRFWDQSWVSAAYSTERQRRVASSVLEGPIITHTSTKLTIDGVEFRGHSQMGEQGELSMTGLRKGCGMSCIDADGATYYGVFHAAVNVRRYPGSPHTDTLVLCTWLKNHGTSSVYGDYLSVVRTFKRGERMNWNM